MRLATESSSSEEQERLREMASKLRQEAQAMEEQLKSTRSTERMTPDASTSEPQYTRLGGSLWTIQYRFSSQPKDEEDEDPSSGKPVILPNYSGKLTIRLREDGFTDIVRHEPMGILGTVEIRKVWGWDKEYSQDDDMDYLLFSMDVALPDTDPKLPSAEERYYLQARVETDEQNKKNAITLKDGTVTCKKDVAEKTEGLWSLFKVAGILSEFRYVGNFAARPSLDDES